MSTVISKIQKSIFQSHTLELGKKKERSISERKYLVLRHVVGRTEKRNFTNKHSQENNGCFVILFELRYEN